MLSERGSSERGSAVVETVFAFVFMLALALGVVQIAFSLYARNVVLSSAHEAARAAIEVGGSAGDAQTVAVRVMRRAAGRVVVLDRIDVTRRTSNGRATVEVLVRGRLRSLGPVPVTLPVEARAGATGQVEVP